MQLTRQGEYTLRTVLELSSRPQEVVATKQIAVNKDIPEKFLAKIVQSFRKQALLGLSGEF